MEDILKQIIRCMIKDPVVKKLIETELQNSNKEISMVKVVLDSNLGLSRLTISSDYRLFLNDYDNSEILIKGYQARTLYLLYLLSPIGISNDELVDNIDIMKAIYTHIYNTSDEYRTDTFINGLLQRKGGISDATHKINKGIRAVIKNEQTLRYYLINGKRRDKRYVMLPKHLITIEDKALQNIIIQMTELEF